jgi:hypothetical protein
MQTHRHNHFFGLSNHFFGLLNDDDAAPVGVEE